MIGHGRAMQRGDIRNIGITTALVCFVYGWLGLSLTFQPDRWVHVPAFVYVFRLWNPQVWGGLYLAAVAAILVGTLAHQHYLLLGGFGLLFGVVAAWFVTFVVDWFVVPDALPYAGATSIIMLWVLYRMTEVV